MRLMDYMRSRAQAGAEAAKAAEERAQMAEALETLGVKVEEDAEEDAEEDVDEE